MAQLTSELEQLKRQFIVPANTTPDHEIASPDSSTKAAVAMLRQSVADYVNSWADLNKHKQATQGDQFTEFGEGYRQACRDILNWLEPHRSPFTVEERREYWRDRQRTSRVRRGSKQFDAARQLHPEGVDRCNCYEVLRWVCALRGKGLVTTVGLAILTADGLLTGKPTDWVVVNDCGKFAIATSDEYQRLTPTQKGKVK